MTDVFEDLLQRARAEAQQQKSWSAHSLATDPYPEFWRYAASLAARWADTLSSEPLDWAVLGALREEAKQEKGERRPGIWFYGLCVSIEKTYVSLREAAFFSPEEAKE